MILTTICESCAKSFKISKRARTRPDLQMKNGDYLNLNCPNCARQQQKHINDIQAQVNPVKVTIGLIAGAASTGILMIWYGYIAAITFGIPILVWRSELSAASAFNGYLIRRKPKN